MGWCHARLPDDSANKILHCVLIFIEYQIQILLYTSKINLAYYFRYVYLDVFIDYVK